jgi:GNAT superfamily N-acetyltransferase
VAVLWKIFSKEKDSKIGFTEGLKNGELFWQSFFTKFQRKSEHTNFLEISYQNNFCGVLAFSTIFFFYKKVMFLKFFALKKSYQGKGIGTNVINELEKMAKEMNYKYIFLLSSPFKKIQGFYRKLGYKRIWWGLFWKKI